MLCSSPLRKTPLQQREAQCHTQGSTSALHHWRCHPQWALQPPVWHMRHQGASLPRCHLQHWVLHNPRPGTRIQQSATRRQDPHSLVDRPKVRGHRHRWCGTSTPLSTHGQLFKSYLGPVVWSTGTVGRPPRLTLLPAVLCTGHARCRRPRRQGINKPRASVSPLPCVAQWVTLPNQSNSTAIAHQPMHVRDPTVSPVPHTHKTVQPWSL